MPWYTGVGHAMQSASVGHVHLVETPVLCLFTHSPTLSIMLPPCRMKILHCCAVMRTEFIIPEWVSMGFKHTQCFIQDSFKHFGTNTVFHIFWNKKKKLLVFIKYCVWYLKVYCSSVFSLIKCWSHVLISELGVTVNMFVNPSSFLFILLAVS